MRLSSFFGAAAVPVVSHRRDEIVALPPVPRPEVGLRWGAASAFSYSEEDRQAREPGPGISIEPPDSEPGHYMRIYSATAQVRSERVEVEAEDGSIIRIDRLTRMSFRYTELVPKPTPAWPQTTRTTLYNLSFELHPDEETEA